MLLFSPGSARTLSGKPAFKNLKRIADLRENPPDKKLPDPEQKGKLGEAQRIGLALTILSYAEGELWLVCGAV
jgi:hypothetical protein